MSTTPPLPPLSHSRNHSTSHSRAPTHHPTTPLRPLSRTSLRASTSTTQLASSTTNAASHPLDALEPSFAELSDSLADLEANMMHLQLLHESVTRFNENFSAFLYGLNMSAFCVDFPEAPAGEAFRRVGDREREREKEEMELERTRGAKTTTTTAAAAAGLVGSGLSALPGLGAGRKTDFDATFLTSDTSFVNDPPASAGVGVGRYATPSSGGGSARSGTRGGRARGRGTGIPGTAGARGSGIVRGRGSGVK